MSFYFDLTLIIYYYYYYLFARLTNNFLTCNYIMCLFLYYFVCSILIFIKWQMRR